LIVDGLTPVANITCIFRTITDSTIYKQNTEMRQQFFTATWKVWRIEYGWKI